MRQFEQTLALAEAVGFSRDLHAAATKPLHPTLCRR